MVGTVNLKGEGGVVWTLDLPLSPNLAKQLEKGQLKPADDDARRLFASQEDATEAMDPDGGTGDGPSGGEDDRPAANAKKATWVSYAQARGIDTEGLTKNQLVDAVDKLDA